MSACPQCREEMHTGHICKKPEEEKKHFSSWECHKCGSVYNILTPRCSVCGPQIVQNTFGENHQ